MKDLHNQQGLVLLETIVALGILVVGVMAVVAMSMGSLRAVNTANNRIAAVNLAREGVELVRIVRDTNWMDQAQTWPFGLNNGSYTIDSESGDILSPVAGNPPAVTGCGSQCDLYLDAQNRFTHTITATDAGFDRMIIIADAAGLETKRVVIEVSWIQDGGPATYRLESHLSNWRPE